MDNKDDVIFFGGTALSRTLLPDLRLSEDIDFIATSNRSTMASSIMSAFESGLARSHGEIESMPAPNRTSGSDPAILRVAGSTQVQIQLPSSAGYPAWPTTTTAIEQRYSDAPPAELTVLTPAAFVAAKMSVWLDRKSPRDLYDLWALGNLGLINAEALDLFKRFGPTGKSPTPSMFADLPSEPRWENLLSHQRRTKIGPAEAAASVESWWASIERGILATLLFCWTPADFVRYGAKRIRFLFPTPPSRQKTRHPEHCTAPGTTAIILRQPS